MQKFLSIISAVTVLTLSFLGLVAPAQANSTPNSFTSVGSSWIDVPEAEKVYFEDFGEGTQDDTNIFYIPAGVTCTINGVTANGPFLAGDDNTEPSASDCTQGGIAYDPVDTSGSNRVGAHPIGFSVNFFGTTYSDLYFNENGGIFFDNPSSRYDRSLTNLAVNAQTSLIAPFAVDLYYDDDEGSFWTAQTTLDGKSAFIISWQEMDECCESNTPDTHVASFQFVFIDFGSGDFNAYFNFDKITDIDQGYAQVFDVDMRNAVTVGSNIVTVPVTYPLTAGVCQQVDDGTVGSGSLTDSSWDNNANYVKLESETTISVWKDSSCTTANNISVLQDVANDGIEYVTLEVSSGANAAAIGWGTFNAATQATNVTELRGNLDINNLFDSGSSELISYSLNTNVPGRIVIGQRGGSTVTSAAAVAGATEEPSAPRAPRYARFDNFTIETGSNGQPQLRIEGVRLWCINSMTIDGVSVQLSAGFTTPWYEYLTADLTGISNGPKTIHASTCMGPITYENWLVVSNPVEPKNFTMKVSAFGMSEALKTKLAEFNSSLGDGYSKVRCIVNSSNGDDMNEAFAIQICAFARSNDLSGATTVSEARESFTGVGYWIRIWASGGN
jgi:hypothetical protein